MDLELLKVFLAVVEADGFTRAADRLARTQSTISQQIRRLEEEVGQSLIFRQRAGRSVALTPSGEILVPYARRLLDISLEARTMVSKERRQVVVRLGVTEDLSSDLLIQMLESCRSYLPDTRLEVTSAWGDVLNRLQASGELDLALVKQPQGTPALAARAENAVWVASPEFDAAVDVVPLAVFPHGCLYRSQATEALAAGGRAWQIAFTGQGLAAVQAAIVAGFGATILAESTIPPGVRRLGPSDGFPPLPHLDLALLALKPLSPPVEAVASRLTSVVFPN
jgi:DNA-binding transcriptional LysR family regulator